MTQATKILLTMLAQHVADQPEKKRALLAHCQQATGRPLYRSMLLKYLRLRGQPTADFLLPILGWLRLEGVIMPSKDPHQLFFYTTKLKPASKSARPASKAAANRGQHGRKGVK